MFLAKKQGELAELLFAAKVSSLGFSVSRAWGDSDPFDFIVSYERHMARVQVRSVGHTDDGVFRVRFVHQGQRYTRAQVDVLVVFVMPEDAWYVIPFRALHGVSHAWFSPNGTRGRFERYREAWDRLLPRCKKLRRSRLIESALPPNLRPKN